jgi:hypothetical protein
MKNFQRLPEIYEGSIRLLIAERFLNVSLSVDYFMIALTRMI